MKRTFTRSFITSMNKRKQLIKERKKASKVNENKIIDFFSNIKTKRRNSYSVPEAFKPFIQKLKRNSLFAANCTENYYEYPKRNNIKILKELLFNLKELVMLYIRLTNILQLNMPIHHGNLLAEIEKWSYLMISELLKYKNVEISKFENVRFRINKIIESNNQIQKILNDILVQHYELEEQNEFRDFGDKDGFEIANDTILSEHPSTNMEVCTQISAKNDCDFLDSDAPVIDSLSRCYSTDKGSFLRAKNTTSIGNFSGINNGPNAGLNKSFNTAANINNNPFQEQNLLSSSYRTLAEIDGIEELKEDSISGQITYDAIPQDDNCSIEIQEIEAQDLIFDSKENSMKNSQIKDVEHWNHHNKNDIDPKESLENPSEEEYVRNGTLIKDNLGNDQTQLKYNDNEGYNNDDTIPTSLQVETGLISDSNKNPTILNDENTKRIKCLSMFEELHNITSVDSEFDSFESSGEILEAKNGKNNQVIQMEACPLILTENENVSKSECFNVKSIESDESSNIFDSQGKNLDSKGVIKDDINGLGELNPHCDKAESIHIDDPDKIYGGNPCSICSENLDNNLLNSNKKLLENLKNEFDSRLIILESKIIEVTDLMNSAKIQNEELAKLNNDLNNKNIKLSYLNNSLVKQYSELQEVNEDLLKDVKLKDQLKSEIQSLTENLLEKNDRILKIETLINERDSNINSLVHSNENMAKTISNLEDNIAIISQDKLVAETNYLNLIAKIKDFSLCYNGVKDDLDTLLRHFAVKFNNINDKTKIFLDSNELMSEQLALKNAYVADLEIQIASMMKSNAFYENQLLISDNTIRELQSKRKETKPGDLSNEIERMRKQYLKENGILKLRIQELECELENNN